MFAFVISIHVFQHTTTHHQLRFTSFNRKITFFTALFYHHLLLFGLSKPLNFLGHVVSLMCSNIIQPCCAPKHKPTTL